MARRSRDARYADLVSAAMATFAERGVQNTLVSDIVRAAGVAQGTFYLYFKTKDDIVLAVVDNIVDRLQANLVRAVADEGGSAVERLQRLCDVLGGLTDMPGTTEIVDFMHRAENRPLHDRLVASLAPKLVELMEGVVRQGVAEGTFDVPDPRAAAWFVLAGLQGTELSGTPVAEAPQALGSAAVLALRALGYREPRP